MKCLQPALLIRVIRNTFSTRLFNRSFFSEAFDLNKVWDNRLNSSTLNKVNIESFYYDLEKQFNKTRRLNAIDVDIFLNAMINDKYITEVEEVVYRLRLSPDTINTLPTTHHAFIRLFYSGNRVEDLIRILDDRLNYGVFPDNYLSLYLMNKFVKNSDYKNAAKIACFQMLQEDFENPLVKYFSLYSIHNYLINRSSSSSEKPVEAKQEAEEEEEEEEEEIVKIRVQYIRTPYFDEHFDLVDPNHLCGKTLVMIGKSLYNSMGRSYHTMGLALYNKWDALELYLKEIADSKGSKPVFKDSISFVDNIVTEQLSSDETKLNNIKDLLNKVNYEDGNLVEMVKNELEILVDQLEEEEIKKQEQLYSEWEKLRNRMLKIHLDEIRKENRLSEVEKRKEELKQQEQKLYFFENEDEIDLIIEEKTKIKESRARQSFKKKDQLEEDTYFPPEVVRKYIKK